MRSVEKLNFSRRLSGLPFLVCLAAISASEGAMAQEAINLRIVTLNNQQASIEHTIEAFRQEYPNVNIEVAYGASTENLGSLYSAQFQAGNPPDIGLFFAGTNGAVGILNFGVSGALVDLSDRPLAASVPESLRDGLAADGKLWGYPLGASEVGSLKYSVEVFDALDLAVPATFPELLELCQTVAAQGITPIAWSPGDGGFSFAGFTGLEGTFVYAQDPDWSKKRSTGEATFASSAEWKAMWEGLQRMVDAGCFSPGAVGTNSSQAAAQFVAGRAAMYWVAAGQADTFLALDEDFQWGMFAVPPDPGKPVGVHIQATNIYAVTNKNGDANLEAAVNFIDFLARPEQTQAYNAAGGNIVLSGDSLVKGEYDLATYPELEGLISALPPKGVDIGAVAFSTFPNASVADAVNDSITAIFTGQRTIDESLAALDLAWDGK